MQRDANKKKNGWRIFEPGARVALELFGAVYTLQALNSKAINPIIVFIQKMLLYVELRKLKYFLELTIY